jgi:hypothetical protein
LAPALYVFCEDQDSKAYESFESTGPVKLSAWVTGRDGKCEVSLFDELGRNEIRLIRILACRLIGSDEKYNFKQDRMVDRLREQIEKSAPLRESDGQRTIGTEILWLNLIAGESTKVEGSAQHLIELDWDANIILSPEDRATPSSFDTFTDSHEERYPGFLMSNIASTVGLWTGVNKSIIELQKVGKAGAFDKVIVQRTFGRAVKTDTLAIRLASSALKLVEDKGNPLIDPTYALKNKIKMQEAEIPTLVSRLVEETLKADGSALSFNFSLEKAKLDSVHKISFKEGLKLFFGFFWRKLISLPRHLWEIIVETFNRKATHALLGDESGYAIEARKDFRRFGLEEKEGEDLIKIADVKKIVSLTLEGLEDSYDYRGQHPELWVAIHRMVTGSLEGSLSGELNEFTGRVLIDAEKLIPKFGHIWTVPSCVLDPEEDPDEIKSTFEWLDVEAAEKIQAYISSNIEYLQKAVLEHREELISAETERDLSKNNQRDSRKISEKLSERERSLALVLSEVDHE